MGTCIGYHKNNVRIVKETPSRILAEMQNITKMYARVDILMIKTTSGSEFVDFTSSKDVILSDPKLNPLCILRSNQRK